jgi:SET domain-containing protein
MNAMTENTQNATENVAEIPAKPAKKSPAKSSQKKSKRTTAKTKKTSAKKTTRLYKVHHSLIHGRGVFAAQDIKKGTTIAEYIGKHMSWDDALQLPPSDPNDSAHTFFFELSDGTIINGGIGGNSARWINHSCDPNAETYEDENGRVWINAIKNIKEGDEITYDYKLSVDGKLTKEEREDYKCLCGTKKCRGYLIDDKKKKKDKKKAKKKDKEKKKDKKAKEDKKLKKAKKKDKMKEKKWKNDLPF